MNDTIFMNPNLPLTEETVEIYRNLYYDHYKPLKRKYEDDSSKEFQKEFKEALTKYGWDQTTFFDYHSIDVMQRLVFEYSHELVASGHRTEPMTSKEEYRHYDPNYGALRLKCPIRSENKDVLN